jgi:hypothetical protein
LKLDARPAWELSLIPQAGGCVALHAPKAPFEEFRLDLLNGVDAICVPCQTSHSNRNELYKGNYNDSTNFDAADEV